MTSTCLHTAEMAHSERPDRMPGGDFPYPGGMQHRAELLRLSTQDPLALLGMWESVTEARFACARHAGTFLNWFQAWDDMWEAQVEGGWYRVTALLE